MRSNFLTSNDPSLKPVGSLPSPGLLSEGDLSEDLRLTVLASFDADALAGDEELARITRFAAHLCGGASASVSLVEAEQQRFIAGTGLTTDATPRSTSLCSHAMHGRDIFEVLDASKRRGFCQF